MKTIEERAEESANNATIHKLSDSWYIHRYGYIKGATEQKQIDADAMHAIVEEQVIKAIERQRKIDIEQLSVIDAEGNPVSAETLKNACEIVRTTTRQKMIDKAWEFMCSHYVVGMEYDDFVKAIEK